MGKTPGPQEPQELSLGTDGQGLPVVRRSTVPYASGCLHQGGGLMRNQDCGPGCTPASAPKHCGSICAGWKKRAEIAHWQLAYIATLAY
eukprot:1352378-Alexandrium_andersonii.AAC.1